MAWKIKEGCKSEILFWKTLFYKFKVGDLVDLKTDFGDEVQGNERLYVCMTGVSLFLSRQETIILPDSLGNLTILHITLYTFLTSISGSSSATGSSFFLRASHRVKMKQTTAQNLKNPPSETSG